MNLAPSRGLAAATLALHALAAGSIGTAFPGIGGASLAALILALGAAAAWNRGLLRGRTAVRTLEIGGSEEVVIELASGTRITARVAPRRHVSRFGVALRLYAPMRRSLFVAADMLDRPAYRRLCLWALWGRLPGGEDRFPLHGKPRAAAAQN